MKVLIIDDNKDVTEMLSEYLQVKEIDCVATNDGMNGLSLIKKEKFDSVFLDISMPDFTGIDVINALELQCIENDQRVREVPACSPRTGVTHAPEHREGLVQLHTKRRGLHLFPLLVSGSTVQDLRACGSHFSAPIYRS